MLDMDTPQAHIEPYVAQIERGFRWLRFDAALEPGFREHFRLTSLRRMRAALLLSMGLFGAYAVVYYRSLPETVRHMVLMIDAGIIVPTLFVAWLLSYWPRAQRLLPALAVLCILVAGFGRVYLYAYAYSGPEHFLLPYEGLLVIVMTAFFLIGLMFYPAFGTCLVVLFGYVFAMRFVDLPGPLLVQRTYYLFAVTLIGSVGCYLIEYAARYNYLYSKLSLHYAENDALTGLSNRRKFMDALDRAWKLARRESKPVALCLIDTDCFKAYNDAFGHLEGDEALKAVAEAIGGCVRRPMDVAARYGGEEFVVVWYDVDRGEALALAAELLQSVRALGLAQPNSSAGPVLTISAGVALGNPSNSADPIQLLRRADDALYRAKAGGRDRVELAV